MTVENTSREGSSGECPVLRTHDLVLSTGSRKPDLDIGEGLTLIHAERESSATVFAMTLAGRMKPKKGAVALGGDEQTKPSHLHRDVALAGVSQLDELERLVPLRVVIREQAAWAQPWYKFVPYDVTKIASFRWACDLLGLEVTKEMAKKQTVGGMNPKNRLLLRIALALVARPNASLLIVDDIDQVRSMELRHEVLERLARVSREIPVIAFSANPDSIPECREVIHLAGASEEAREESGGPEPAPAAADTTTFPAREETE